MYKWIRISWKQFQELKREKTIIFAIMIQLVIAMFSSFLVVGIVSLYDPSSVADDQQINVGVVTDDENNDIFVTHFENQGAINTAVYSDIESAQSDFETGDISVIVESTQQDGQYIVDLTVPESGLESTVISVRIQESLSELETEIRNLRMDTETSLDRLVIAEDTNAPAFVSFSYTVLLPLLILFPAFISGAVLIDNIIQEKKIGGFEILQTTPVTDKEIVYGMLIPPILLSVVQVFAWLLLLEINSIAIANWSLLILLGAGITMVAVSIGLIITRFINNRGFAQSLYSAVLVLVLSASVFLPEIPFTTIATLGVGSYTGTTIIMALGYFGIGLIAVYISSKMYNL